jgi:cation diffusion facilitator CzcD-associated flavoprotein CzcO
LTLRVKCMLDFANESLLTASDRWLAAFEQAISNSCMASAKALFHSKSHWRDLLALTWDIQTFSWAERIIKTMEAHAGQASASNFKIAQDRTPPRLVIRAGKEAVETIFTFDTAQGRGNGVLRLVPDADDGGALKAWTLMTALSDLKGFEERIGDERPTGDSRDFHGPNWLDLRKSQAAFTDRDPSVLVVGAGQAGLSIAACLIQLGVDTLVVERNQRVGDNWRNRYHALTLHNQVHVNHLPYMPFPPNWPSYIPKDKLAGWFEAYAEIMELNVWTSTEFLGGSYDEKDNRWSIKLRLVNGETCEFNPAHVVMAAGVSCIPNIPDIQGLQNFKGEIVHASAYGDGEDWKGQNALVIGTGNSGHDIAQDLYSSGVQVTLVQRSPTMIVNIEPGAQLPYSLYDEGPPLEDCDLIAASMPLAVSWKSHQLITEQAKQQDQELLDRLEQVGFKLDFGEDGTGWQFLYMKRGGGYCFNVGCSDLIADGKIRLVQFSEIADFLAKGAQLGTGERLDADLVVLATGYKNQEALVQKLFGDGVADSVGPIWGFSEKQELRNMYVRTRQPGLWFIAGSFAQCRIYSRFLALQIKACEEGLLPVTRPVAQGDLASNNNGNG